MAHQGTFLEDVASVQTPAFVIDLGALEANLRVLGDVQRRSGAKILLALKAYAAFSTFPLIRRYLTGICASGLHEALLGRELFGGEVHVYSPAYSDHDLRELLNHVDHISFNSFAQWKKFGPVVRGSGKEIRCGIRINPQHSEVKVALYDPCAAGSRLGVPLDVFEEHAGELDGITGLHSHTLCELNADSLQRTLKVIREKFGNYIERMEWMNLGGGHHITRDDYDVDLLCRLVAEFRADYPNLKDIYLEPGEAIALHTGVLVSTVLDIVENSGIRVAVLDTSVTAHMPDVLEMPYRPQIVGGDEPGKQAHTYRLGGQTCLAGDVIGDYSFGQPLEPGSRLIFLDMAHYTMVKTTTFNGVKLPDIVLYHPESRELQTVRRFGYEDYKSRLS